MHAFAWHPSRRAPSFHLLLLALVASGCNELPKRLSAGQPIAPGQRKVVAPEPGVPAVVYTSPQGSGADGREVVAIFSEPMAPVERALTLEPAVEGETRWAGEHTLVFVPRKPLPPGRYSATLAAGLRTKTGTGSLLVPHQWAFAINASGARQNVAATRGGAPGAPLLLVNARVRRHGRSSGLTQAGGITVTFNAPVDLADLERKAKFVLDDGARIDATATAGRRGYYAAYTLTPKATLPRGVGVHVALQIEAGLLAADTRPALATAFSRKFPTIAPLRLWSIYCPASPAAPLRFYFNEEVRADAVISALEVTPAVKLRVQSDATNRNSVALAGRFRAGTEYRVRVAASLSGDESAPLGRDVIRRCTVPTPQPRLRFAVEGSLLEQAAPKQLPVWADLVSEVAIRLRRVPDEKLAAVTRNADEAGTLPVVHEERRKTNPRRRTQVLVDPAKVLTDGKGVVLVEVEGVDAQGNLYSATRRRMLVNATDLGLTTKQSPSGVLTWVTRLSDGSPVLGVAVSVRDEKGVELGSGTTGEDGAAMVQAKLQRYQGYTVLARKDDDVAWIRTDENQWMFMPSSMDVPEWSSDDGYEAGQAPVARGLLFSERGIYRPGETVRLKGIVRRETEQLETVANAPVWLEVKDGQNETVFTRDITLSEFGTFAVDVPLGAGAALGSYLVTATVGKKPTWRSALSAGFRVEEFRAPDFEVKVDTERRDYFPGESPKVTVRGRYFFGAKMQGAPVSWRVASAKSTFAPPNHPGFLFRVGADPWEGQSVEPERRQLVSEEGTLDERGEKTVDIARPEADRVYTIEGTVKGMDRTEISGRTQLVVHPATFYLGVQAEWTFMELTETFRGDLVAVAPDGTRQVGVPIEGTIYQGSWESVRKLHEGGTASVSSLPAPKKVGACSLTSSAQPARCEFKAKEGGYFVLWATAKDGGGRAVSTAISFYVMGPTTSAWAASDSVKMTLRADRHEYKLGDTARILVQNPFPEAEALITIERDRVMKRFRQKLVGPAPTLRIPITEDLMPNVFVSVVAVRGRVPGAFQATGDDPRRPLMRVGHAMLRVSPESRRVSVDVLPVQTEYRPGQEAKVRLRTLGPDGKPIASELTVWAVDEGVLSLVAYKTPDPVKAFAGLRGLAIMTSDTRYRALRRRAFEEKGHDTGGGGGSDGPRRKVFKAVAFFDPSVRTDQNGEATVTFTLPDNMTTFRIMAVAVTKAQRFGKGEAKIVSTKRMLLQPSLPRFVRVGDRLEAGVVVHNRTGEAGEAKVTLTASGLVVEGVSQRAVRVEAGRAEEVRFTMRADAPGVATLAFDATLGRERDGLEVRKNIHLQTVTESVGLSGESTEAVRHVVGPVPDARNDVGGLQLVLSGSRLAGLAPSLAYLMEYPYGCGEQTTSGLLPLLALGDLAEATGELLGRNVKGMIDAGLRRLATFQRDAGGFSMWPDGAQVDPWVSGYIMFALAQAKERGHAVDAKVLEKGIKYLKSVITGPRDKEGYGLPFKANALYALAALGAADGSLAATAFESRAAMNRDGRAMLARALSRMGERARAGVLIGELLAELGPSLDFGAAQPTDAWRYFGSAVRTKALVLEALSAHEPGHAMVRKLADALLAARDGARWRTTQEAAYSLFALSAAERAEAASSRREVRVWVNGKKVLAAAFGPGEKAVRTYKLPMTELVGVGRKAGTPGAAEVVIEPRGGPIRYSARLVYAPIAPRATATEQGLALYRTYERVKVPTPGAASFSTPSATEAAAGELVRVTLHVAVPRELRHAVIDDPLPAGLESVNVNLATEAQTNGANGGQDNGHDALFTHRELRDDRVVLYAPKLAAGLYRRTYLARATMPGRYGAPSTRGEGMYAPEVFGSTPATTFTVVPPIGGVATK